MNRINREQKVTIEEYDYINRGLLYHINNSTIRCGDGFISKLNQNIWQHKYSELVNSKEAYLASDIIEDKGELYFYIAGTPNNKTFCIDIESGEIEHTYRDIVMFSIIEGDLLYNLFNNTLNILNTTTQEIHHIDMATEFKKYHIYPDARFAVQNGLVYFMQSMGDDYARIGIIDPKQEKVVWKYEFPDDSGQVGDIKVQGNRIYAHTQDFTLHIFERDGVEE